MNQVFVLLWMFTVKLARDMGLGEYRAPRLPRLPADATPEARAREIEFFTRPGRTKRRRQRNRGRLLGKV